MQMFHKACCDCIGVSSTGGKVSAVPPGPVQDPAALEQVKSIAEGLGKAGGRGREEMTSMDSF